jgi:hypothetical protein
VRLDGQRLQGIREEHAQMFKGHASGARSFKLRGTLGNFCQLVVQMSGELQGISQELAPTF